MAGERSSELGARPSAPRPPSASLTSREPGPPQRAGRHRTCSFACRALIGHSVGRRWCSEPPPHWPAGTRARTLGTERGARWPWAGRGRARQVCPAPGGWQRIEVDSPNDVLRDLVSSTSASREKPTVLNSAVCRGDKDKKQQDRGLV